MYPYWTLANWKISNYFLLLSIDFCLMLIYLRYRAQRLEFNPNVAIDIGIISAISGFIGARLFHVFYEYPEYYRLNPVDAFKLWNGGYVFLAGAITALGTGIFILKIKNKNYLPWLDLFAPVLALGYGLGRWACFLQGCCYGKETHSFLGLHFEQLQDAGESFARLPTQLITSSIELLIFFGLIGMEKQKKWQRSPGQLFYLWLIGHGANRMMMEVLRDDPRGPLLAHFGISFWLAMGWLFLGFVLMLRSLKWKDIPFGAK